MTCPVTMQKTFIAHIHYVLSMHLVIKPCWKRIILQIHHAILELCTCLWPCLQSLMTFFSTVKAQFWYHCLCLPSLPLQFTTMHHLVQTWEKFNSFLIYWKPAITFCILLLSHIPLHCWIIDMNCGIRKVWIWALP